MPPNCLEWKLEIYREIIYSYSELSFIFIQVGLVRSFNRIFLTFLTAYVLLILIPLITGIAMNSSIAQEYEDYVKGSHLTHLKKTRDVLESFLEDIKWSTYQLAGNTKLLRLIADREKKLSSLERSSLIRETMIELNDSLLYNTSFNSIFYIYLKDQDIIITPYSIYTHSDFNDSANFFKMENISSEDWHRAISNQFFQGKILPVRTMIIEDFKNKRMIPYVQSLPIDQNSGTKNLEGAIVYLIGESDFIRFLDTDSLPEGGFSYIADDQNNLISLVSSSNEPFEPIILEGNEGMIEKEFDGQKMFIIYTTSRKNSWKYVSVLPEEWVVKNVSFYRLISIAVMSLALLFSLAAAYYISNRFSQPIVTSYQSISGYLNKEIREKVSLHSFSSNVKELIHYSEDMEDELLSREVFVHNAFVNRLINGFFLGEKDLEKYLNLLGFSINETCFSVAIISQGGMELSGTAQTFDEMIRVKNLLKERIQQEFPLRVMVAEQDNSNLILILMTTSKDCMNHERETREALRHFSSSLPNIYTDSLFIALGGTVQSLLKIHSSYIQAQDVLAIECNRYEHLIVHFNEIDEKLENYYFPLEMESRLINSIKAGNQEMTENLLETLEEENRRKRLLDQRELNRFITVLQNCYSRLLNQIPEKTLNTLESISDRNEDKPSFEAIQNSMLQICRVQNGNKKSHNLTLVDKVSDYLEKNYSNRNMSLQLLADHFSVNESYLSFFFKEQTGTNFSTFLEKIRINKAGELLRNTDEPIHIIAGMVGYNSDKTFRRVFQKHYQMSPGKYRE